MKELIGTNLICYAISFIIIFLCDISKEDKIKVMIAIVVFIVFITTGAYLLVGV